MTTVIGRVWVVLPSLVRLVPIYCSTSLLDVLWAAPTLVAVDPVVAKLGKIHYFGLPIIFLKDARFWQPRLFSPRKMALDSFHALTTH